MAPHIGSIACLLIALLGLFNGAAADQHVIGDSLGWTVPPGGAIAYETWAQVQDFEIGDTLVFNWTSTHNVAEVSKADYDNCTTTSPMGTIQQRSPVTITLDSNSTRYFICTVSTHCELGQKVTIGIETNSASSLAMGAFSAILSILVIFFLNSL